MEEKKKLKIEGLEKKIASIEEMQSKKNTDKRRWVLKNQNVIFLVAVAVVAVVVVLGVIGIKNRFFLVVVTVLAIFFGVISIKVPKIQEERKTEKVLEAELNAAEEENLPKPVKSLSPDYFRVDGESLILCISLILFSTLLIALSSASLAILPILIIVSVFLIKTKQGQLLGQSVKVSEHQLPDVYAASKKAASRLFMPMPDIFVTQNPVINAYAIGFLGKKSVVLNSKTVEAMTNEELTYILGHEFAHIKCNHTKWMVITSSTESVRIPILSSFFGFIFLFWSRKAEYTADRGGLIASKDLKSSITALLKVAVGEKLVSQMDIARILRQQEGADIIDNLSEIVGTHPYTLNRIRYLKDFYQSRTYNDGVCNMA
jgi:Zn-dependent protease with chaperone function